MQQTTVAATAGLGGMLVGAEKGAMLGCIRSGRGGHWRFCRRNAWVYGRFQNRRDSCKDNAEST
jgi:hypothetical protein